MTIVCNKIIRFVRLYTAHSTFKWSFAGGRWGRITDYCKITIQNIIKLPSNNKTYIQLSQWLIKAFKRQKVKLFKCDKTLPKTNILISKKLLKNTFFILLTLSDFLLLTDANLSPQT